MGISRQPDKWQCGPYALKHALLMRGVLASEWEIGKVAGTTPLGTDENQLARVARHYGCELPTIRKVDADGARQELVTYLREGTPCLLCVNGWDHWVTAVQEEKGRFVILDSQQPDVIVEDLVAICGPQTQQGGRSLSFGEFLRRHAAMIIDQLDTWHGKIDRDAASQVLQRMRFVADTYGLVIRQSDEKRTISAVSMILALWSAAEYGSNRSVAGWQCASSVEPPSANPLARAA
ncbi:MAG: hypothetical protein AMS25_19070 [Gemmatimonas sp. SM23_52]|nr:MAG: hypothetical protein AMS25_19070 [Gemmatimonas sp. SM23_52]